MRSTLITAVVVIVLVPAVCGAQSAVAPAQGAPSSGMSAAQTQAIKERLAREIDGMRTMTQQMVDQVFSFGELGYQEFETSKYLTGILQKNGFLIQTKIGRAHV